MKYYRKPFVLFRFHSVIGFKIQKVMGRKNLRFS